jgi:hypothetical protein
MSPFSATPRGYADSASTRLMRRRERTAPFHVKQLFRTGELPADD